MTPTRKIISVIFCWLAAALIGVNIIYFKEKNYRSQLAQLNSRHEELLKEAQLAEVRLDELKQSADSLQESHARTTEAITVLEKELSDLTRERDGLLKQIEGVSFDKSRIAELTVQISRQKEELKLLVRSLRDDLPAYGRLQAQRQELLLRQQQAQQQLAELQGRKDALEETAAALRREPGIAETEDAYLRMLKEKESLSENLENIERQLAAVQESRDMLARALEEQRKKVSELEKKNAEVLLDKKRLAARTSEIDARSGGLGRKNRILIEQIVAKHFNAGLLYLKQKEYRKAAREFEEVVKIDPRHSSARFNLGSLYAHHLSDTGRAVEHLRVYLQCVEQDEASADWVREYVRFREQSSAEGQ